jgi:hypothetical protein
VQTHLARVDLIKEQLRINVTKRFFFSVTEEEAK